MAGLLVGRTQKEAPSHLTLPVTVQLGNITQVLVTLVDSGAEQNILDPGVASLLHLPPEPLPTPIMVSALDGVTLIVSGNHSEVIEFLLALVFP